MTRAELLELIKRAVLQLIEHESAGQNVDLPAWRERLDAELLPDAPLTALGWDSMRMTWLLVRLEEELSVDTSTLSLYELFTVGDLLDQLLARLATGADHSGP